MVKDTSDLVGPHLPWAGKQVPTAQVEDELSHLWRMSSDNVRTSQNVNVRTSVLNLVVCVSDVEAAQLASTLIRDLSSTHIARVTILILDSNAPDMVATWITTRSFPVISDVTRHTFEQITLMVHGSAVRAIAQIVQPLVKPHLPVYLWWLNDPPNNPALFEAISKLSNRIIVDSSSFITPEESIRTLSTLAQTFPESGLSDLNWGRITPWRELVAQFFDTAEYRSYLAGIHTIEIEHAAGPFAEPTRTEMGDVSPNSTCALLLAGWLEMQLGWHYAPDNPHVKDKHETATGTHTWHMIRPTGSLSAPLSNTNGSKSARTSSRTQANLHIRPRVRSDMRPGSLCMVRLTGTAGSKQAIFTINRENDDPNHVLTSVALEQETRPKRTVSMAATRKVSTLLHDELEIISRDYLYEETLQEVRELLS
ncbi:MAG: glucose-6-phosphate dehydrogenase assembly protein OpcA [Ktedonobacteraceae bacterium]